MFIVRFAVLKHIARTKPALIPSCSLTKSACSLVLNVTKAIPVKKAPLFNSIDFCSSASCQSTLAYLLGLMVEFLECLLVLLTEELLINLGVSVAFPLKSLLEFVDLLSSDSFQVLFGFGKLLQLDLVSVNLVAGVDTDHLGTGPILQLELVEVQGYVLVCNFRADPSQDHCPVRGQVVLRVDLLGEFLRVGVEDPDRHQQDPEEHTHQRFVCRVELEPVVCYAVSCDPVFDAKERSVWQIGCLFVAYAKTPVYIGSDLVNVEGSEDAQSENEELHQTEERNESRPEVGHFDGVAAQRDLCDVWISSTARTKSFNLSFLVSQTGIFQINFRFPDSAGLLE